MKGNLCELSVLVHGKPVREYQHEGRLFLEGRKGRDFTLRVKNLTQHRILAVLSIDGLSIVTGEDASVKGGGYVLNPKETMSIPGWSLNNDEVARFFFHKAAESYAGKQGKPRNVGVIGCAVFKEKRSWSGILRGVSEPVWYGLPRGTADSVFRVDYANVCGDPVEVKSTLTVSSVGDSGAQCTVGESGAQCNVNSVQTASEIGTGFGKRQDFKVQEVAFERESESPNEVLEITYDTRKGLEKRGVDLNWKPTVGRPSPFPGDRHCKPPAGWNG